MTTYVQLSLSEREVMFGLLKQRKSLREIARKLGRNHTTLSRELKNNRKYGRAYLPCKAQARHERVSKRQRYRAPLKSPPVYLYVRTKLKEYWSPEQIAGRLLLDSSGVLSISKDTVYNYLYKTPARTKQFVKYLAKHHLKQRRYHKPKGVKLPKIKDAIRIDKRHYTVDKRTTLGNWETDLMEGVRSEKLALSVEEERVTRYTKINPLINKTSESKTQAIHQAFNKLPKKLKKTITTDNGTENTNHQAWSQDQGVKVYFCYPYHSWEKGGVENTIGRVRRFIPKGTPLSNYSSHAIKAIEERMNNTPRKCLNYKTPKEKLMELLQYKPTYKPKWCSSK